MSKPDEYWMTHVPNTDDEAEEALLAGKEFMGPPMVGIFRVKRAQGLPTREAYEQALLAGVSAGGAA